MIGLTSWAGDVTKSKFFMTSVQTLAQATSKRGAGLVELIAHRNGDRYPDTKLDRLLYGEFGYPCPRIGNSQKNYRSFLSARLNITGLGH